MDAMFKLLWKKCMRDSIEELGESLEAVRDIAVKNRLIKGRSIMIRVIL